MAYCIPLVFNNYDPNEEELVAKIIETVSESGELDNEPKFEGKNLTLMVLPKKLIKAVKKENVSTKNEVQ